ncbi:MAG: DNA cytosine methyltransferase [Bacteroidales bacterium]|nr:DNA cytosine methyltransferase [Bacteroidales bacterium]
MLDEIIVDNFAGGGGASTGIELATGRPVTIAINHDPAAILMHKTNHPYTEHLQASVWDVDPEEVCAGRPVGLAWFSPDCKHFSKAKGKSLVDRNIRGLAWIVLRWAGTVRPRIIILENVEEFQTWGPVRRGKPVKSKAGQTFRKWLSQLRDLGYEVEHRELVAADYGAPTTRKRFVLVARCDGQPIRWPERTHAPKDSAEVKSGKCLPWRSAAEIIDWSVPMYSVFMGREELKERYGITAVRPLADNTLRRIIRGVDKFTVKSGKPFIVPTGYGEHKGQKPRVHDIDAPLSTVVSTVKQCLVAANFIQYHTEQTENVRANGINEPLPTVDASNRYGLTAAHLTEYYGNGNPLDLSEPMHTVTAHDREALTAVHMAEFKGQDKGQSVVQPLRTVTAYGGEFGLVAVKAERYSDNADLGYWPQIRELLNDHCGYHLAEDEVLLLKINSVWYYMSDISLRMLTPKELYAAMGFPPDYIIDRDYTGKAYPKSQQVARCGNAVCPPMATAVVRANMPEWSMTITTMAELIRAVAI